MTRSHGAASAQPEAGEKRMQADESTLRCGRGARGARARLAAARRAALLATGVHASNLTCVCVTERRGAAAMAHTSRPSQAKSQTFPAGMWPTA
jgi:hypothetical protein